MRRDQTVCEMVVEVLSRQARALAAQSGQTLEEAMAAVLRTEAGRQLRELADGPHRDRRASDWQAGLLQERAEVRRMRLVA